MPRALSELHRLIQAKARVDGVTGPGDTIRVFAYGTLCRGEGNHHVLAGAPYLGGRVTVERFRMGHVGFPLILPARHPQDPTAGAVQGEAFLVSPAVLIDLDRLEGEGVMYDRRVLCLTCPAGEHSLAYGYVWRNGLHGQPVPPLAGLLDWPAWIARGHGEDRP